MKRNLLPRRLCESHSIQYAPSFLIPAALGVLSLMIYTRLLGTDRYGSLVLVLSTLGIGAEVFGEWLAHSTLRFYPEARCAGQIAELKGSIAGILSVNLVSASAFVALLLVAAQSARFIGIAIPCVLLTVTSRVWLATARARMQAIRYTALTLLGSSCSFLSGTAICFTRRDPISILIGQLIGASLQLGLIVISERALLKKGLSFFSCGRPLLVRAVLRFGLPIALTSIGSQTLQLVDRFILAFCRPKADVGLYAASYGVGDKMIALTLGPIMFAFHPLIIRAWSLGDRNDVLAKMEQSTRTFIVFGIPCVVGAAFFGRDILTLLAGATFAQAHYLVPVIGTGTLFWYLGMIAQQPLELEKQTGKISLLISTLGIVNTLLNVCLIPAFGYWGAAFATLASYGSYNAAVRLLANRHTALSCKFPWRAILKSAGWSIVLFGGVAAATHRSTNPLVWLLAGAFAAFLYLLIIWKSGEFREGAIPA